MKKKIIAANWKMNPDTKGEALLIYKAIAKASAKTTNTVIVCPPFPFIPILSGSKKVSIGAQNVSMNTKGPFTGEVDAKLLKTLGVTFVIIGHSERRAMGENNEIISQKLKLAIKDGLRPILCIGENERDHSGEFFHVIRKEIKECFSKISKVDAKKIIVAYEPIWAISSSKKAEPITTDVLRETILFIRKTLADICGNEEAKKMPIIYGGSVDQNNAYELVTKGEADGLLIGKVSLDPKKNDVNY